MTQKVWPACGAVVLALSLLVSCAGEKPTRRGRPAASASVGKPFAFDAPALDGRRVSLATPAGKVRVVDLWASWCAPCRESMPHLDELARELGPRGVEVYGIALDDDSADVRAFLAEVPVGFTILWDPSGQRSAAARLPTNQLPTTLIVDRQGIIRFVHEGWRSEMAREQRRQLEELLGE